MPLHSITLLTAAVYAIVLGLAAVVRKRDALASWVFLAGMGTLAADAVLGGCAVQAGTFAEQEWWLTAQLVARSFLPGAWLCFSLVYCRGNAHDFLARWWWVVLLAVVGPPAFAILVREDLVLVAKAEEGADTLLIYGPLSRPLTAGILLVCVLVLMNLEKTMRTSVGTVRWRIKYLFIGLGLIFGVRIYTLSQGMLFSGVNPSMTTVDVVALLIGCALMTIAYVRKGFGELDLYPSRAALQGSLTIILVGAYLIVVGVLAQVVTALGVPRGFPAQAFIILVGIVGLAVALLSDRFRSALRRQIVRHFSRPQHDSQAIWTSFTRRTFGEMAPVSLCRAASGVISETFQVLTIRVFLLNPEGNFLTLISSTYDGEATEGEGEAGLPASDSMSSELRQGGQVVGMDGIVRDWIHPLQEACPSQFPHGGARLAVPLRTADRLLGVMVLADRVNGVPYTQEERDLLGCLGDQLAANLLNARLTEAQMQSKQLEAFQTMATFFVHDLKNAANSLGLMLQNLPNHFDDPEFRKDALRGLGKSADRINDLITRLGTLRSSPEPDLREVDFNELIEATVEELGFAGGGIDLRLELGDLPIMRIDREKMGGVITNLLVNGAEAMNHEGQLRLRTVRHHRGVLLEIEDDGCGMSREYVKNSLFRPFQSTKSKGLGIGMFQTRMMVEAHRGTIDVRSAPGQGTRFRIFLPAEEPPTKQDL